MAAGMDLSVGSMVSVCSVIFGLLAQHGVPVGAVVLLTVMTGIGMGVVNGVLVAFLDVLPLIATLATLFIYATVAQVMIGAQSLSSIPNSVITLGSRVFFGFLPEQTLVIVVVAVVAAVLLERTVFGRQLGFIGANDRAANYAGIAVRRHRFETYLGTGVACAIASMVQVGFFASARSDSGTGLELVVITACLVGGIDAWGGSGSVLGVMLGCAIIATLEGWMDLKNIEPTEQQIAVGAMLVLTVGAQQLSGPIGIWLKERKSTWQNTVGPVGAGPLVSYGLPEAGETEAVMMAIEDPGR
jgi:ribose/xylose/arabinose/galactoside ABC-type transport system permease subunit